MGKAENEVQRAGLLWDAHRENSPAALPAHRHPTCRAGGGPSCVCVWGGGVVVKMNNLIYKVTKSNLKNNHNDDDLLSLAHAQYLPSIISLDDPSIPVKLALELIILLIIPSFTGKETKPWRGRS